MFFVKSRKELARFALFLAVAGLLSYYVAGKFETWRSSRSLDDPGPAPGAPVGLGGSAPSVTDGADYFADFRMNRERNRAALRETLKEVMDSAGADQESKRQASQQYLSVGRLAALEDQSEVLVRAKGFEDVIISLTEASAQVVVRAKAVSQQQFLQVVDVVSRATGIKASAISVMARER